MRKIKIILAMASLWVLAASFYSHGIEIPDPGSDGESSAITLDISTDKTSYTTMENIWFTIQMGGQEIVDIYMSVTFPDGSFSSYSSSLVPDGENAIIPLFQGFPLTDAAYTLPLPVIPLWPEGTSEIWMIFVKHQKNPLNPANRLADDKVQFSVEQSGDIDPFFDLEKKTFSAQLGDMGVIEITFDQENIYGVIFFTGEDGNRYELKFSGAYVYEDEILKIHLQGEYGFFSIDFELGVEDGLLYGDFIASTGTSGSISFDPETQEVDYAFERRTWHGSLGEVGEVTVNFEEGLAVVTLTGENQQGEPVNKTLTGTCSYEPASKVLVVNVSEEGGDFSINIDVTLTEEGSLVGEYVTSGGKSGSVELNVLKAMLEHLGVVDNSYQVDLGESGMLTLVFEQGSATGILSLETDLGTVEKSIVIQYSIEGNTLVITAQGEDEFLCTIFLTYENGTLTGSYEAGRGLSGSTAMTPTDT